MVPIARQKNILLPYVQSCETWDHLVLQPVNYNGAVPLSLIVVVRWVFLFLISRMDFGPRWRVLPTGNIGLNRMDIGVNRGQRLPNEAISLLLIGLPRRVSSITLALSGVIALEALCLIPQRVTSEISVFTNHVLSSISGLIRIR